MIKPKPSWKKPDYIEWFNNNSIEVPDKNTLKELKEMSKQILDGLSKIEITEKELYNDVLEELSKKVKKDQSRKVCQNCHELGHYKSSVDCPLRKQIDLSLMKKIKAHVLGLDQDFESLAEELSISVNKCQDLYRQIPVDEFLEIEINRDIIGNLIKENSKICDYCHQLSIFTIESMKTWKDHELCDQCWWTHENEREELWNFINSLCNQCNICNKTKTSRGDRFHYDHINMFDKSDSVCNMVSRGDERDLIQSEINKCQLLCLSCHQLVTRIERIYPFTRIKTDLTRKKNLEQISEEDHQKECAKYNEMYKNKMEKIYSILKDLRS
jgi:hypothetical protein